MRPPTAVLAEDEPLLRRELKEALTALWPELAIVAEAEDGMQAAQALDKLGPDVIFLDIQMPGMTGLDVARTASGRCHVVFVTAYDQYAVDAFERGAVDYVMKPFMPERLAMAIGRVRERMASVPANLDGLLEALAGRVPAQRRYLRWITVAQGRSVRLIPVNDVCYFQADNKYTLVVTAASQSLINKPIKELLDELDPESFLQIHRGTLVNINAVAAVHRDLRGRMEVQLKQRNESLPVSASFTHLFRQM
ncbi:MAG TPA: LytTR family DNA-binding domain-containing protein [Casimicrobiaceae bacterium]|nr:LytTR family DNA-binding domain-containing protein [Casimicrobiaceae bacterium]